MIFLQWRFFLHLDNELHNCLVLYSAPLKRLISRVVSSICLSLGGTSSLSRGLCGWFQSSRRRKKKKQTWPNLNTWSSTMYAGKKIWKTWKPQRCEFLSHGMSWVKHIVKPMKHICCSKSACEDQRLWPERPGLRRAVITFQQEYGSLSDC